MRRRRRLAGAVASGLTLALLASGCGSSSSPAGSPPASPSSSISTLTPLPMPERVRPPGRSSPTCARHRGTRRWTGSRSGSATGCRATWIRPGSATAIPGSPPRSRATAAAQPLRVRARLPPLRFPAARLLRTAPRCPRHSVGHLRRAHPDGPGGGRGRRGRAVRRVPVPRAGGGPGGGAVLPRRGPGRLLRRGRGRHADPRRPAAGDAGRSPADRLRRRYAGADPGAAARMASRRHGPQRRRDPAHRAAGDPRPLRWARLPGVRQRHRVHRPTAPERGGRAVSSYACRPRAPRTRSPSRGRPAGLEPRCWPTVSRGPSPAGP